MTDIKIVNAHINKSGYVIAKDSISSEKLSQIKNDLIVAPEVLEEYSQENKPYPIYRENEEIITVPRYYGVNLFGETEQKFKSIKAQFKFIKELREYQNEIIDKVLPKMKQTGGGLLSLPCGRGKTVIALAIAQKLKYKTLVLVHKSFLQDQWIERAKFFTDAKIGIIRQSTVDIQDKNIVIGMIQSISMKEYDPKIFNEFGLIIVDECHHIASKVFSRALRKCGANYTLGLSATPKRQDGLTKVIHWYLGKMLYSEAREPNNHVVVRKLNLILDDPLFVEKTQWSPKGLIPSMPKMITNLSKIKRRNKMIVDIIDTLRHNPKRKILILSGRIEHLENLKAMVDKRLEKDIKNNKLLEGDIKTCFYIGKLKQAERRGTELYGDILFASYEMAHEGLDIDRLNTIILATPKRSVVQAIGRIMRKILTDADIKPLIIDITDNLSAFTFQGDARLKLYRNNDYCIKEFYVNNDYQIPKNEFILANRKFNENDNIELQQIFDENMLDNISKNDKYEKKETYKERDYSVCLFDD